MCAVNSSPIKRIVLAPMEGVLDYALRHELTQINNFDYCVTEFVRVTNHKLTPKTFYRLCPELYQQGKTATNTPVRVQLLGQSPELLAQNAQIAIELGSYGIDLNCGCPAKSVVGNQGGAFLLKHPDIIYQVTKAVKQAVGENIVSVKIRLGWDDKSRCFEIADAIEQAGANEIVIHGRTKEEGYKADKIDWNTIGQIKQKLTIPVIANGEIFSYQDALLCASQAKTDSIMIGRGILSMPNLANVIKHQETPLNWNETKEILKTYASITKFHDNTPLKPLYHCARIKQWLSYLKLNYPQAQELLEKIRTLKAQDEIYKAIT